MANKPFTEGLPISRRSFVALAGRSAAGGLILTVPQVLYRSPFVEAAKAQSVATVRDTFIALVEAVTTVPEEKVADWIIAEFDKALPPLPEGSPSGAVAALLDIYTISGAHGPTFAQATPEARREVLEDMVKDPSPDIQQVANQILPFAGFAYYSDVALGEPATVGGPRLEHWDRIGWPGPSHGYRGSYRDDSPEGFSARGDSG